MFGLKCRGAGADAAAQDVMMAGPHFLRRVIFTRRLACHTTNLRALLHEPNFLRIVGRGKGVEGGEEGVKQKEVGYWMLGAAHATVRSIMPPVTAKEM